MHSNMHMCARLFSAFGFYVFGFLSLPLDSLPLDSLPLDSMSLVSLPLDSMSLDALPLDSLAFGWCGSKSYLWRDAGWFFYARRDYGGVHPPF